MVVDSLTIAAAAGLRSRLEALDIIANNIANSGAAGYKADHESSAPYVSAEARLGSQEAWRPDSVTAPNNNQHWIDHSQGALTRTSEPLDMALYGDGMFEVATKQGPRWTRNGSFQINARGKLETQEGHEVRVRPADGTDYGLTPDAPVNILRDGSIYQRDRLIGQIEVMKFDRKEQLAKQGSNYFRMLDPTAKPSLAIGTEVRQGYNEAANTGATQSAVRLVSVMRHFEALQRAIVIGAEMNKKAVEEVGRMGS